MNNQGSDINIVILREGNDFAVISSKKYQSRMAEKVNELAAIGNGNPIAFEDTPEFKEESNYKLHISLASSEYYQHRDWIIEILKKYVQQNIIKKFKYVDSRYIIEHKRNILGDSTKRFLDSDQFTLYIPLNFDKNKIVEMCKEINEKFIIINNQLREKNESIKSGKLWDVESPLGDYMCFRQEYLSEDFNNGNVSLDKRINVIPDPDDEVGFNDPRRVKIKKEQETTELYILLSTELMREKLDSFFKLNQSKIPLSSDEIDKIKDILLYNKFSEKQFLCDTLLKIINFAGNKEHLDSVIELVNLTSNFLKRERPAGLASHLLGSIIQQNEGDLKTWAIINDALNVKMRQFPSSKMAR